MNDENGNRMPCRNTARANKFTDEMKIKGYTTEFESLIKTIKAVCKERDTLDKMIPRLRDALGGVTLPPEYKLARRVAELELENEKQKATLKIIKETTPAGVHFLGGRGFGKTVTTNRILELELENSALRTAAEGLGEEVKELRKLGKQVVSKIDPRSRCWCPSEDCPEQHEPDDDCPQCWKEHTEIFYK